MSIHEFLEMLPENIRSLPPIKSMAHLISEQAKRIQEQSKTIENLKQTIKELEGSPEAKPKPGAKPK